MAQWTLKSQPDPVNDRSVGGRMANSWKLWSGRNWTAHAPGEGTESQPGWLMDNWQWADSGHYSGRRWQAASWWREWDENPAQPTMANYWLMAVLMSNGRTMDIESQPRRTTANDLLTQPVIGHCEGPNINGYWYRYVNRKPVMTQLMPDSQW